MDSNGREKIREVLREEYIGVYGDIPERFDDNANIFNDLHADEPDSVYALEWYDRTAKRLRLNILHLPNPKHGVDYTIGQMIDILENS